MAEQCLLGRRRLLLLGATATAHTACGTGGDPLGGPFGGTTDWPGPVLGTADVDDEGGIDGSGSGGNSGGSSGSSGGSGETCSSSSGGSGGGSGGTDSGSSDTGVDGSDGGGTEAACGPCSSGGNVLTLTFSMYPQLLQPCGVVSVSANGYSDPTCMQNGVIVFNKAGTYVAFSSSCTHACCTVTFKGSEIRCPCHGATYDLTGKPTNSVAKKPLPSLPVCSDACGVYVTV